MVRRSTELTRICYSVHMTNTRITDPEIFERRYRKRLDDRSICALPLNSDPLAAVILHQFGYRQGSGGEGLYRGGNGVVREMEFLQNIEVSLLTERRARQPYGLAGGHDGKSGLNIHVRVSKDAEGKLVRRERNLGGKATVAFEANDRLVLNTPGGGGWGLPGEAMAPQPEQFGWQPRGSLAERSALEAAFGA